MSDADDDIIHEARKRRPKGGSHADGVMAHHRLDRKAGGGSTHWIAGAIKHPGALHQELHVPAGEKIPDAELAKAARSGNPTLAKRAHLAETLKGLGRK